MTRLTRALMALAMALLTCQTPSVLAGDSIEAGRLIIDPPTLICGSFQWFGSGDDDRDATVSVAYRKAGRGEWRTALPMYRLDKDDEGLVISFGKIEDNPSINGIEIYRKQ